jgi:hypothetical protein
MNIIKRPLIVTLLLLIIPILGNMYIDGWNWSIFDFIFAFVVFMGTGITFGYVSRKSNGIVYKLAVAVAVFTSLALIWINGAVGLIGDEDNGTGMLYLGVVLIGFIGIALSRFKATGLSRTAFVMAGAQFLVPIIVLLFMPHITWGSPGIAGTFILNSFFVGAYIISGVLFQHSVRPQVLHG